MTNTTAPETIVTNAAGSTVTRCSCSVYTTAAEPQVCRASTTRLFAPGHDAKLKGRLIRAGVADAMVTATDADGNTAELAPMEVARLFGFARQVQAGIALGKDKEQAKAERKAKREAEREARQLRREAEQAARREAKEAKAAKDAAFAAALAGLADEEPEAEEATPALITAKVGRWLYTGTEQADGTFVYEDKQGKTKVAPVGGWTLAS
jgi:hypothetical protein